MNTEEQVKHAKRMRVRAVRLQVELACSELEQLIMEEPTGIIRDSMTEANIYLNGARVKLKRIGESI